MIQQEREVSVQAMVEVPYVYLLARSTSSIKDQLLYVPTRLEDLEQLDAPITIDNTTYICKMRFFSGMDIELTGVSLPTSMIKLSLN